VATPGRAYRGPERRRQPPPPSTLAGHFVLGGLLVLSLAALFAVLSARGFDLPDNRAPRINELARTGTVVLAGAVSTLSFVRWRLGAETALLLLGTAVLVFGLVVVGAASIVVPLTRPDDLDSAVLPALRAGGLLVVLVLLVLAVVLQEVNTTVRALRVIGGALVATAVLAAVLAQFPHAAEVLAFGRRFPLEATPPTTPNRLALGALFAVLALALCVRGLRRGRTILAWAGLMLLALALSEMIGLDAVVETDVRILGSEALQMLAMGLLLVGVVGDFERNFLDQRARLFDSQVAMRAVQVQAKLGTAVSGRRRHDLANALMGLDGAAGTLEKYYDQLDEGDRKKLTDMVATSVDRLRALTSLDPSAPLAVRLADVAAPMIAGLEEAGLTIEADLPDDVAVRALPEEVAEVLGQVSKAVLGEDPVGPVKVAAVRYGDQAWLSVEFCPANHANGAAQATQLGRLRRRMTPRATPALGRGMDLSVAAHIVSQRGGQLLAEPVGDDAVAIRLQLPADTAQPPQ